MGTMTSKGQITVPKEVREAMGLTPGTRVDFRFTDGQWTMTTERIRAVDLAGVLKSNGRRATLDDMQAAIEAGAAGEDDE